jgi:hypothetical protein
MAREVMRDVNLQAFSDVTYDQLQERIIAALTAAQEPLLAIVDQQKQEIARLNAAFDKAISTIKAIPGNAWGSDLTNTRAKALSEAIVALQAARESKGKYQDAFNASRV